MNARDAIKAHDRDALRPADRAVTEQEIEFLILYGRAKKPDQRRLTKILRGAAAGQLPPPAVGNTWTQAQWRDYADTLPEVLA